MGSGKRRLPAQLKRSEHMRITFRTDEVADLRSISAAWQIPPATIAWAIIHTELQKCRKRAANLGEVGLAIVAAQRLLGRHADGPESDAP